MDLLGMMGMTKDTTKLSTTVKMPNGKYVFIDSCYTLDHGYETMAFESDENGNVLDWMDIYSDLYDSVEEMKEGHERVCENFRKYGNGYGEED